MKKFETIALRFLIYFIVAFAVYLISFMAYLLILEPETITKYEVIMTAFSSAFVSREICDKAFERSDNNG